MLQSGNDNIRNAMDTWKIDAPMVRGMPIHWIPAWSNLEFGLAGNDGLFMGVDVVHDAVFQQGWASHGPQRADGGQRVPHGPRRVP